MYVPPVVEQVANSLSPILYGPRVFSIFLPFSSRMIGLLGGTEIELANYTSASL